MAAGWVSLGGTAGPPPEAVEATEAASGDDMSGAVEAGGEVMGILPGQTLLELTPEQVRFQDTYKIGKKLGNSWSLPAEALRPSDVTWHFEREKPVVGINYGGNTLVISSTLALAEVEWLIQELQEYLSKTYMATLPQHARTELERSSEIPFLQLPVQPKPSETTIERIAKRERRITFCIPKRILSPESKIGAFLGKDVLDIISLLFGKRTIEMTPTWIHLGNEYFGLKLGKSRHIPTDAIRTSDITWYFKKVPDSTTQQLVVGINHAGRTVEIGTRLTQEEAKWLIHEISQYISNHAK